MSVTRSDLLIGSAGLAAGATVTTPFLLPKYHLDQRPKRSRVAILNAQQYSQQLDHILAAGLRLFPIDVRGKTVLLKPNLVDYIPGNAINTDPLLILAAADSFRRLGAKSVLVAEGPGHQRDTQPVPVVECPARRRGPVPARSAVSTAVLRQSCERISTCPWPVSRRY